MDNSAITTSTSNSLKHVERHMVNPGSLPQISVLLFFLWNYYCLDGDGVELDPASIICNTKDDR